jgi:hypothetical protein
MSNDATVRRAARAAQAEDSHEGVIMATLRRLDLQGTCTSVRPACWSRRCTAPGRCHGSAPHGPGECVTECLERCDACADLPTRFALLEQARLNANPIHPKADANGVLVGEVVIDKRGRAQLVVGSSFSMRVVTANGETFSTVCRDRPIVLEVGLPDEVEVSIGCFGTNGRQVATIVVDRPPPERAMRVVSFKVPSAWAKRAAAFGRDAKAARRAAKAARRLLVGTS